MAALIALALFAGLLLWLYHPGIPRSVSGWLLLIVLGVPTWFSFEWLGGRIFDARFFSRFGRVARIAMAVPIVILLLIVAAYVVHLGQRAIGGS